MALGVQEEILTWGTDANCYAYAANCLAPARGNVGGAIPGGIGGAPVFPNAFNYPQALATAAVSDGFTAATGTPGNAPNDTTNTYLVALISHAYGFHWLRRDPFTKRWSWKDGNTGSVKLNVMHAGTKHFVYINDSNLNDLLVVNRGGYVPWYYTNMTFVSFFRAPSGGVTVAGR